MSIFAVLLRTVLVTAVGVLVVLVSIWYGQHHNLLPVAASKEASLVDGLFEFMLMISTGLFIFVQGIIIYSAIAFRRRKGDDTDGPPVHGNVPLEIIWTGIPTVIVLFLAIYSFDVYKAEGGIEMMSHPNMSHAHHEQPFALGASPAYAATLPEPQETVPASETRNQQMKDEAMSDPATAAVRNGAIPQLREAPGAGVTSPEIGASPENQGKPPDVVINVTALRYGWLFTYPGLENVEGELHVPAGREVSLNISANDVIHAFWVPEFRLKQDAVPGRETNIRFTPVRPGEYTVRCAELCGPYHGAMNTKLIVMSQEDYDAWLQEQEVASSETSDQSDQLMATTPSPTEPAFLTAHLQEMGIESESLAAIRAAMPHAHHSATLYP
ncbi:cytochrome c oxidase subunit II [Leptolyngbya sp. FACHB-261]|uniref:cytochrome c oxidase subunit II n=1 Tax=Leptolyngbya sp. FACHB-261 TaxID=2692806 RepID=UPI0028C482C8|nr:cytochrome c oxidase subunit II [Leptolyngbya sp. FACHB-261]